MHDLIKMLQREKQLQKAVVIWKHLAEKEKQMVGVLAVVDTENLIQVFYNNFCLI